MLGVVIGLCFGASQTCTSGDCGDFRLHPALEMKLWRHSGGGFTDKGNGNWVEDDGGLTELHFTEVSRELHKRETKIYDKNRNLYITLTPTSSILQFGSNSQELFRGSWVSLSIEIYGKSGEKLGLVFCTDPQNLKNWLATFSTTPYQLIESESTAQVLTLQAQGNSPFAWLQIGPGNAISSKSSESHEWTELGHFELLDPGRSDIPEIKDDVPVDVINPSKRIALVTLYTPNIEEYAREAERNQAFYAKKYDYTLYVYRDSVIQWNQSGGAWHSIVTWNKIRVVMDLLEKHDWVVWIDSDAIFTNLAIRIEDILAKAPTKEFLVCKDPKQWLLNTGVMMFQNTPWTRAMLDRLWGMPKVHHSSGAEQNQLIKLLQHIDPERRKWELFPEDTFNCHPDNYHADVYVVHYMGMGSGFKRMRIREWNEKLGITA